MAEHDGTWAVTYWGWSAFTVAAPGGTTVAFDPVTTPFIGPADAGHKDFAAAEAILVTHGHFDHCWDAPPLAQRLGIPLISSPAVCEFARRQHGTPPELLREVAVGDVVTVGGIRVHVFEWIHRVMDFSMIPPERQPYFEELKPYARAAAGDSPKLGFVLETPGLGALCNYCEGFNNRTDMAAVEEIGRRHQPAVVLAGVQFDYQPYVARAARALGAPEVLLFEPHGALWRYLQVPSRSPDRFAAAVQEQCPRTKVRVLAPREPCAVAGRR
jgi:hypothetical protein